MSEHLTDTNVGNIEYISKDDAISAARHAWAKRLEPSQYIELLEPADVAHVVFCKDCVKHNKKVGFDENFRAVWKEDACPLVSWRGKAQGSEFDYQFCSCGKRREG